MSVKENSMLQDMDNYYHRAVCNYVGCTKYVALAPYCDEHRKVALRCPHKRVDEHCTICGLSKKCIEKIKNDGEVDMFKKEESYEQKIDRLGTTCGESHILKPGGAYLTLNDGIPRCMKCHAAMRFEEPKEIGGTKNDDGKPDLSLVPREFVVAASRAFGFGVKKYARDNWRLGIDKDRLVAAMLRHTFAWKDGELRDPESGLSHLDHAAASLAMLITLHDKE